MRTKMFGNRLAVVIGASLVLVAWVGEAKAADDEFRLSIGPFLQKHCIGCHGPEKPKAGIRYDRLAGYSADDTHLWTVVHEKIASGTMPPESRPRPSEDERRKVLEWIVAEAKAARQAGGFAGMRRLNRRELGQSLKDLLGIDVDFSASLPEDGIVDGFDTANLKLVDNATTVATTLEVIHKAVSPLRFLEPPPKQRKLAVVDLAEDKPFHQLFGPQRPQGIVFGHFPEVRGVGAVLRPHSRRAEGQWPEIRIADVGRKGLLRIRWQVAAQTPRDLSPPWLLTGYSGITGRASLTDQAGFEVTGTLTEPQSVERLFFVEDMVLRERSEPSGVRREGVFPFRNIQELPYAVPQELDGKLKPETPDPSVAWIVVRGVEVEFPYTVEAWPPGEGPLADDDASAAKVVAKFAERAFRRPVTAKECEPFLNFYRERRQAGDSFDQGLRNTLSMLLLSGRFRFLAAPASDGTGVDQYALASRLSYMFWSTLPDRELLALAAAAKLLDPKILDAQVDRLLNDPRAERFVTAFTTQWLDLNAPIRVSYPPKSAKTLDRYFANYLLTSLRKETIAYHAELLRRNLPARNLVASDFAMMNDTTAYFHEYPRLVGSAMRPIRLRPDDPRGGGILGHAGIQSMTTANGVHWPVARGAWALRTLFDAPTPPPPLEVPELDPNAKENRGKTVKELLKQHSADARCAVCHQRMDPLGFAFQNFDLSGRWRDVEHESYGFGEVNEEAVVTFEPRGKTRPVDAAGSMPRGEPFANFAEMKALAEKHYLDDIVLGYLKRLVLYGAGRRADVLDMETLRDIAGRQKPRGYPLRDLIKEFVRSRAFTG